MHLNINEMDRGEPTIRLKGRGHFICFCVCVFFQVAAIQAEVTKQQQETEEDLAKAEPALQAANAALNTLNRVSHSKLCYLS